MNPGVVEETGETARTFINTMKDHPAILVLAICNLALIVFMYFGLQAAATFRTELIKQSFEYQKQAAELLARCVLQPKGSALDRNANDEKQFKELLISICKQQK